MLDRIQSKDLRPADAGLLNPAMLIAATINSRGNIDLPLVENGALTTCAGVEFGICGDGEVVQQRYRVDQLGATRGDDIRGLAGASQGARSRLDDSTERGAAVRRFDPEPMDMVLLASGLAHLLERHTPSLFRLSTDPGGGRVRLACTGEAFDHRRIRLLHDAFAIHLLAYEERLV